MSTRVKLQSRAVGVLALAGAAAMSLPAAAFAARNTALDGPKGPSAQNIQQSLRDLSYTMVRNDPRPRTDEGLRLRTWNGVQQNDLARLAAAHRERTEALPARPPESLAARDTRITEPGFRPAISQPDRATPAPATSVATLQSVPSRGMFAMPEPEPVARGGGPGAGVHRAPAPGVVHDDAPTLQVRSMQHVPLQLGLGCTTITAVGTPAVREVSLRVQGPLGDRVVHDARAGRTESLAFCPTRPGAYALDVQLDGQGTGPLAAQVFVGR